MNVAPAPSSLTTRIDPPDWLTIPYAVDRPRPVPLPCAFVVKNGSKIRARVASSIPTPVSLTTMATRLGAAPGRSRSVRTALVAIISRPPSGIASRALTARLRITCSSWPGSARTNGIAGSSSNCTAIFVTDHAVKHVPHLLDDHVRRDELRLQDGSAGRPREAGRSGPLRVWPPGGSPRRHGAGLLRAGPTPGGRNSR